MFQIVKWRSINAALIALPLGLSSKASTGTTLSWNSKLSSWPYLNATLWSTAQAAMILVVVLSLVFSFFGEAREFSLPCSKRTFDDISCFDMGTVVPVFRFILWVRYWCEKIWLLTISTVTQQNSTSPPLLERDHHTTVLENPVVMCWSRPTDYYILEFQIWATHNLDIQRHKAFSISKNFCHSTPRTFYGDMCAVYAADDVWKPSNFKKLPFVSHHQFSGIWELDESSQTSCYKFWNFSNYSADWWLTDWAKVSTYNLK